MVDRLPPPVRRSLAKLGSDLAVARQKRRLTQAMMAERLGVSKVTYRKVEQGEPTTALGVYAMAFFVLGLGTPLGGLADASGDSQALLLDSERLPRRVRVKRAVSSL